VLYRYQLIQIIHCTYILINEMAYAKMAVMRKEGCSYTQWREGEARRTPGGIMQEAAVFCPGGGE
jgi:hypothetical protein